MAVRISSSTINTLAVIATVHASFAVRNARRSIRFRAPEPFSTPRNYRASRVKRLAAFRPDPYILALLGVVLLASFLPARGAAEAVLGPGSKAVVALLFFLHGAKLSRQAVVAGLTHWRLHLAVLAVSFLLFPLLGLGVGLLPAAILPAPLAMGMLFLCCLPSTVQSSIAFTALARGNVAAAVCAASASNLLGMAATPLLVGLLMHAQGAGPGLGAVGDILLQLLVPFIAGQIARPWLGGLLERNKAIVGLVDRGAILLVVYSAFSHAVNEGVWSRVSIGELAVVALLCAALLALVLLITARLGKALGFSVEDQIVLIFCGSKKSLVTGAPMAAILFVPAMAGVMIVPLMIYHQMQMLACAWLARRYALRPEEAQGQTAPAR
ncbi:MAG: bile acid:sodium symporter [Caulobacter sp.]|nr:bile acid:sodium symporter [Caulobacter sp.]